MTDEQDPLEVNLERLLRAAPDRERLDVSSKTRLAGALREAHAQMQQPVQRPARPRAEDPNQGHAPESETAGRQGAQRRTAWPKSATWVSVLAAAAVLLAVLALRLGGGESATDGRTRDLGAGVSETTAELQTRDDRDPERTALGPGPRAGSLEGDAPRIADGFASGDLMGSIRIAADVDQRPKSVAVWVRPVVQLPRVADASRHSFEWTSDGDQLPFRVAGALAGAHGFGATEVFVQVEAPGLLPASAIVSTTSHDVLDLEIGTGASVRGFVTDASSGAPIEGALVFPPRQMPLDAIDVAQPASDGFPQPYATTDAAGAFTIAGVDGGDPTLRISKRGYGPVWVTGAPTGEAESFELRATLSVGGRIAGTVERSDGTRWADAIVIASLADASFDTGERRGAMTFGRAITEPDGRYVIEDLASAQYVVLVFGSARPVAGEAGGESNGNGIGVPGAFQSTRVRSGEETRVDFLSSQARGHGSLRGRLLASDGQPLGDVSLSISETSANAAIDSTDANAPDWKATTTAADGSFSFDDLNGGQHVVLRARSEFRHLTEVWSGDVTGPTSAEIRLPDNSVTTLITRTATDNSGASGSEHTAGDGWIMLERYEGTGQGGHWQFAGSASTPAATGSRETFSGLPPGRYRFAAISLRDGESGGFSDEFELAASDDSLEIPISVQPGGALTVRVENESTGAAIPDAQVSVSLVSGRVIPQRVTAVTGSDGRCTIPKVPFGEIVLHVTRRAPASESQPVSGHRTQATFREDQPGADSTRPLVVRLAP